MRNKKSAFTLAEVLLVLAIIGVIAAVTIPSIMQQSSEKKYAALSKKAISTMQNAIDLKIASIPIGPGDMQTSFFGWLLDGEDDGANTIKAVRTNAVNNPSIIQTADGMIFWTPHQGKCTTASTRTNLIGCTQYMYIDLNGADPPTKTTVDDLSAIQATDTGKAYDVIFVTLQTDGKFHVNYNNVSGGYSLNKRRERAKKYLDIK